MMGYAHPMEGWLDDLGPIEGHERKLSSSRNLIYCTYTNPGGTCICMVGSSCTDKTEPGSCEGKIQVLDSHTQIWPQGA